MMAAELCSDIILPYINTVRHINDCIVLCTGCKMAEELCDENLVIRVIRKTKHDLAENICYKEIIDELYCKSVINKRQYDLTKTCMEREGEICAIDKVLDMAINGEVQVPGFMKVLKEKMNWEHANIQEGVRKFKSGEWITPGLSCKYRF